jgi:DNA polymerase I-like protein with 3'-5' exonuclease and polymerase domains
LPRDVSKDERDRAKPMNFGFAFGMSADTFVSYARDNYGLTFSSSEARVLRHRFFGLYWGVGAWHKRINYQGRRSLEARTASGRLRKFDTFKMTEMLNTPIQGTAADGIKRGMALLYPKLDQVKGRVVNVIHDELIVEVPTEYAEVARGLVEGAMIAGMQEFLPDVPVAVESGVADKWKKV